jgi:hypothetical protein
MLERKGIPAAATPSPPVSAVAVNKNFLRSLSKPLSFFDINFLLRNVNSELREHYTKFDSLNSTSL